MPAVELDRKAGVALWRQVQDDLRSRIDAEEFVGAFPGEKTLAQEYGVSRQTMRQALRPLRESGVVSAERGRPPQVRTDVIEQPIGALYSLFASVERAGMRQHSHTIALDERCDPEAAQQLALEPTARLVHLARLRFADEAPLALDRVWLPARIAAPLLQADFSHTALYREMAERMGLFPRRGTEVIQAVALTEAESAQLQTPPGAPAFHIERTGWAEETPIEWRTTLVRGDRFRVSSQFTPTTGFQWGFDATDTDHQPPGPTDLDQISSRRTHASRTHL